MFHSFVRLLIFQVEHFYILWCTMPHICTNYSKTLITSPIKNSVRDKVVVHCSCWIIVKHIYIFRHTYLNHLQKTTLNYVEFVWNWSWPTLFLVVIELVSMHVRTDSEPSRIHTQNSLTTLCKLLFFRESYTNSRSSLTISTMWPRGTNNHLILVRFFWYCVSIFNQILVKEVKCVRVFVTLLVSTPFCIVVAQLYVPLHFTKPF